jgi:hypothetical protein
MTMGLSGHAASMGGIGNMYKISIQKVNVKADGTDGKRALKWIFRKLNGRVQ